MNISAFAPGKLILMGEHAVVYGHRAVAMAVNRGTTVRLESCAGPTRYLGGAFADPRLDDALAAVLPAQGLGVHLETTLPVGRGMGSSAALAVALARARCTLEGRRPSFEALESDAFRVESIFHGKPSGIDHTVSICGGGIVFHREADRPVYDRLDFPSLCWVVLDSGETGNTAEQVATVAAAMKHNRAELARIGELVEAGIPLLRAGDIDALGPLLTENHERLRSIGVSTPRLEALVRLALDHGALGAKIAGAGGGGVVLALCREEENILQAAKRSGIEAFAVSAHPPEPVHSSVSNG